MFLTILFTLLFVALLFRNAWRGCKVGPIRCLAPLIAFFVASICSWLFGSPLGFTIFAGTTIPWILRGLLGILLTGTVVWLIVFSILWAWGRSQLSKATGENEWPIWGALVGCWLGIFMIAVVVLVVNAAGTLGATLLSSRKHSESVVATLARGAVYTQQSLGNVPCFDTIARWDPMPAKTKRQLEQLVIIASEPRKFRKFLHADEVQSVLTLPSVYPIFNSDEVQSMIADGDVDGLLTNPQITKILDDQAFQEAIKEIDYERLLDELAQ